MNETITLPQLISRLASAAGCTPAEARKYIHDLFAEIEQTLVAGKNYTLDGIGEFAPGLDASHPVLFRADPALAKLLNEPFEAFSAVELPAEVTTEMLTKTDEPEEETKPETIAPEPEPKPVASNPEPEPEPVATNPEPEPEPVATSPEPEPEPIATSPEPEPEPVATNPKPEPEPIATSPEPEPESIVPEPEPVDPKPEPVVPKPEPINPIPVPEQISPDAPQVRPRSTGLLLTCGIMIGLIVGLVVGYFAGARMGRYYIEPEEDLDDTTETVIEEPADIVAPRASVAQDTIAPAELQTKPDAAEKTAETVAAPTAKEPVYDTITQTQFLTTLARKHYGVKNYWIFIYEANPGLGNPNSIRPGTRLLIPDRSTFEEATPEATADKARQHLNRLAAKYKL